MIRWKRSWPRLSESMPVDVLPASNGEHFPRPPTEQELLVMRLQDEVGEHVRARLGMSRRDFVRSAAAMSVGMWVLRRVMSGQPVEAHEAFCELHNPTAQLENLPGEFIFDIQTHHVEEDGLWRVTNPGFHAFFTAAWPQSQPWQMHCPEPNRMECLGREHYVKEVYLDSSTTMGVLSAVPSSPDRNPLPTQVAADTVQFVNDLSGASTNPAAWRAVMHQFVMPNRGSYGGTLRENSLYLQDELDSMTAARAQYPYLRAWKCYTPWGDIPNASGWFHDDFFGRKMIEHAIEIGMPVIATHKGFALPSFDQRSASPRDIGPVASEYYDANDDARTIKMIVYHSGYDSEQQVVYPGDAAVDSSARGVNSLIKSLRENGWSARHFAPGGTPGLAGTAGDGDPERHGNVPNVYAEIGSTWRGVMASALQAAHLLGKLIYYVGPRRVVWGTDSLWYGSPQATIVRLRQFPGPEEPEARAVLANEYRLPHALDGDVDDPSVNAHSAAAYNSSHPNAATIAGWPTDGVAHPERSIRNGIFGRNAAGPYQVDPDAVRQAIDCSELEELKNGGYVQNAGTPMETRPLASNVVYGARTRRELLKSVWPNKPWSP